MTAAPRPRLVDEQAEQTRVCEIRFLPDREHEAQCLLAWKRRTHPAWSQHAVSYRVTGPKIRLATLRKVPLP